MDDSKSFGKSIRMYLADGIPTGIRYVELVNWSGQAIATPRNRLPQLKSWDEAKRPGVYFLLTKTDVGSGHSYIGESEDVYKRLANHDREKDFWTEVVIFTSKDQNLTKAHIRYLESRLVELAYQAERYSLENAKNPTLSPLPRGDRDAMEEFLVNIRMLMGVLGHRLLESLMSKQASETSSPDEIIDDPLKFTTKGVTAYGQQADEGFLLLKGSQITGNEQPSMPDYVRLLKTELIQKQTLLPEGDNFVLQKDHLMSSSSAAACLVAGDSRNGRESWKNSDSLTLKELEEQALQDADESSASFMGK